MQESPDRMKLLRQILQNNTPEDWLYALLALTVCMTLFELLRRLVLRRLARANGSKHLVLQLLAEVIAGTRILLSAAIGVYVAVQFLDLPAAAERLTDRLFIGLLLLQTGFWASRALDFWLRMRFVQGESEGARAMTRSMLTFIGRLGLWSLVILLILDNMGLNVTALVASLGIGGVAVALAAQNILGDLFASLSIALDKPFVLNDFIIVDDLMGTVEHVGLKTTRVRSLSGEQIVLANNDLLKSRIRNYGRMQERRAIFAIGVTYDTPAEKLEAIPALIRAAIEAQPGVRFDRSHFKGFGAFSLDFETVYYLLDPGFAVYMDTQQAINLRLVRDFAAQGISFAFPTQTLHLDGRVTLQPAPGTMMP